MYTFRERIEPSPSGRITLYKRKHQKNQKKNELESCDRLQISTDIFAKIPSLVLSSFFPAAAVRNYFIGFSVREVFKKLVWGKLVQNRTISTALALSRVTVSFGLGWNYIGQRQAVVGLQDSCWSSCGCFRVGCSYYYRSRWV